MIEDAEVVVIGGGVMGTACAYALTERGLTNILLVEQEQLAFGSSGSSAAVIETQYLDENMVALTNFGFALCSKLETENELPFSHHGYLRLAKREQDLERYHQSIRVQADLGIQGSRVLSPEQIAEVIPGLSTDGILGALWGPHDGFIDAVTYCNLLMSISKKRGASFERATVDAIEVTAGAVSGVHLSQGRTVQCSTVINAAGAWARQIGKMVDLEIPVDGYRRQILILEPKEPFSQSIPFVIDYVPGAEEPGLYFRGDGPNRLIAGMHREGYGAEEEPADVNGYGRSIDWEYGAELRDMLIGRLPWSEKLRPRGGWAGLYPLTPDSKFILGEAPAISGFYNAVGGGGVGVQCSAGIGAIVADLIVRGETQIVPRPEEYRIERFSASPASSSGE